MPAVGLAAEALDVEALEWQLRDHRDAVIALLSVERDVLIAEPLEPLQRKGVVDALGFLQAEHVGPRRLEEFGDEIDAQPHRVDVPGCQGKTHETRLIARNAPWKRRLSASSVRDLRD